MATYKDPATGTWYCKFRYKDWSGVSKQKKKRGFARKQDAQAWEREFLSSVSGSCDMLFSSLVELYLQDCKNRLRPSTYDGKVRILHNRINKFFGDMPVNEITPIAVRKWQNDLMKEITRYGRPMSPTTLRSVHAQLSSVFNYAMTFYGLPANPARLAGSIGADRAAGMQFWTKEEFDTFIGSRTDPIDICVYNVLFYTGIRSGELRALDLGDFDFKKKILHITKTISSSKGEEHIGPPKTRKGKRDITLPDFLCNIIQDYVSRVVDYSSGDLLFPVSRSWLRRHLNYGCEASGVKRIRVHDLRHSHASLLIQLGFPVLVISERLGHENIKTTLQQYGHLYPEVQENVAGKLDGLNAKNGGSGSVSLPDPKISDDEKK